MRIAITIAAIAISSTCSQLMIPRTKASPSAAAATLDATRAEAVAPVVVEDRSFIERMVVPTVRRRRAGDSQERGRGSLGWPPADTHSLLAEALGRVDVVPQVDVDLAAPTGVHPVHHDPLAG